MNRYIFGVLCIVMLLVSCKKEVIIDNPLKGSVKVFIDGKEILLKSNSVKTMKVSQGINHVISILNTGDTVLNEHINIFNGGILNITNSEYVTWRDVFCEEEDYQEFRAKLNLKDTVTIDGLEFIDIDLEITNASFIVKNWDVGLDKKMPKTVEIGDDENFKIVSKIYRSIALKDAFNYYGDYDFKDLTEEGINKVLKNRDNN